MKIEGAFRVAAPRAVVWARITDPALMAACVPGCEAIERQSPTRYGARIKLAIGPIKAMVLSLPLAPVRAEIEALLARSGEAGSLRVPLREIAERHGVRL